MWNSVRNGFAFSPNMDEERGFFNLARYFTISIQTTRMCMRKFVLAIGVLSFMMSSVQAERATDKNKDFPKANDSLVLYKVSKDSLEVELVKDLKSKVSFKRMENAFDAEKTPVHPKDLPSAIKETLNRNRFKDWKTTSANFVKPLKGKSYYEIALLRGTDYQIAKFKDNGKVL